MIRQKKKEKIGGKSEKYRKEIGEKKNMKRSSERELARREIMGRKVLTQAPDFSLSVERQSAFALSQLSGSKEPGIKGIPFDRRG